MEDIKKLDLMDLESVAGGRIPDEERARGEAIMKRYLQGVKDEKKGLITKEQLKALQDEWLAYSREMAEKYS